MHFHEKVAKLKYAMFFFKWMEIQYCNIRLASNESIFKGFQLTLNFSTIYKQNKILATCKLLYNPL